MTASGKSLTKRHPSATSAAVGGSTKPTQARFSRDETKTRILDAAEELFSKRDPNRVTVREIAEKAGVTHPLVHQYVGSKAEILDAVIKRGAPHRHQIIAENPVFREVLPTLFADVLDRKVHTRAVVRSAMDGVEYAPFDDRRETGRMLLDLAERTIEQGVSRQPGPQLVDKRVALAACVALAYGWTATDTWLLPIFDLQDEDPDEVRAQLLGILAYLSELVFPPAAAEDVDED